MADEKIFVKFLFGTDSPINETAALQPGTIYVDTTNNEMWYDKPNATAHSKITSRTHSQASMDNTDLNNLKEAGWYFGSAGMTNAPVVTNATMEVLVNSANYITQRFIPINSSNVIHYSRNCVNGTWGSWQIALSGSYNTETNTITFS